MATSTPRAVFVHRETDYEQLLARHSTPGQARFFLETRGQRIEDVERQHQRFQATLREARASLPPNWRLSGVRREDLDRFLFGPEDVIVAVGQDGLVANVAKYLNGQPVIGINPAPDLYDGVLVRVPLGRLTPLLSASAAGAAEFERRTMVEAVLDTGERLLSLNEIFVGHRSHQSARYTLEVADVSEYQSSSGMIVASGTGATGWARSIMEATSEHVTLGVDERAVAFFVREPFPSVSTGTSLRFGKLAGEALSVISRMNEGGVVFADGIEQDFLAFDWGRRMQLGSSAKHLNLVR
jgi:hypothetical protein